MDVERNTKCVLQEHGRMAVCQCGTGNKLIMVRFCNGSCREKMKTYKSTEEHRCESITESYVRL